MHGGSTVRRKRSAGPTGGGRAAGRRHLPVLFSVSYAGLWGQAKLSLEEFIPHARALGYPAVELMGKRPHLSPLDWPEERVAALRDLCARHEVQVACVAAYTDFGAGALEAAEVPFADIQAQYVESLARIARSLNCGLVRIFTAYERDGVPLPRLWDRTIEAIRLCCDRCASHEVAVGLQNHHDVGVHTRSLLELLGDVDRPNCKLMLDPWSPCLRGEELSETARRAAPHVVYTTLADYIRLPRYKYHPSLVNYERRPDDWVRAVPMGEGDLDTLAFLRGLEAGGFTGPIAYEMCSPLRGGGSRANLDRCARQFLTWLANADLGSATGT